MARIWQLEQNHTNKALKILIRDFFNSKNLNNFEIGPPIQGVPIENYQN